MLIVPFSDLGNRTLTKEGYKWRILKCHWVQNKLMFLKYCLEPG